MSAKMKDSYRRGNSRSNWLLSLEKVSEEQTDVFRGCNSQDQMGLFSFQNIS